MVRVIVVGGGYGGITVAGGLDDVAEITLVEQKDQFVHHAVALRTVVNDIWAHTTFMSCSRLLKNGQAIQDKATKVRGTTVHLATHEPVIASYLVLVTGSTYPYPTKQDQSNAADAKARLEEIRDNLSQARRVLLVGVGTVGVEFVGEPTLNFPDVEVVMADCVPHILGSNEYAPQLRDVLTQEFGESGVCLVLGSSLSLVSPTKLGVYQPFHMETQDGVGIDADTWFLCYGAQAASGYLQSTYADRPNEEDQLAVDEYLRVKGSENVYAVGDLTDVSGPKRADATRACVRVVVANIRAVIAGKAPSTVYTLGKVWAVLPPGMEGGVSQLTGEDGEPRIAGPEETAETKGNDLMVTMVRGQLHLP